MKILVAHNFYINRGGEDVVFKSETDLLRQYGHSVTELTDHNARITELSRISLAGQTIWSKSTQNRLMKVLNDVQPEVVHFHNTFPLISPSAYDPCFRMRIPVVQTLHNFRLICPAAIHFRGGRLCDDCLGKTPPWPGVIHACYHNSRPQTAVIAAMLTIHRWRKTWNEKITTYIALSNFSKKLFVQGGIPKERIVVKPNFIIPDPGYTENRERFVLYVGRLSAEKGLRTLLKAWTQLKKVPLKIVGDGPEMKTIQEFTKELEINNIEFLGEIPHVQVMALMKRASFLVFPSETFESFGMTIAEAFACGTPVIASKLGSIEEIVEDGRNGLHFNPGDFQDLKSKISWAWNHSDEMLDMRRDARKTYEEYYSAEVNYKSLMSIYNNAISSIW